MCSPLHWQLSIFKGLLMTQVMTEKTNISPTKQLQLLKKFFYSRVRVYYKGECLTAFLHSETQSLNALVSFIAKYFLLQNIPQGNFIFLFFTSWFQVWLSTGILPIYADFCRYTYVYPVAWDYLVAIISLKMHLYFQTLKWGTHWNDCLLSRWISDDKHNYLRWSKVKAQVSAVPCSIMKSFAWTGKRAKEASTQAISSERHFNQRSWINCVT